MPPTYGQNLVNVASAGFRPEQKKMRVFGGTGLVAYVSTRTESDDTPHSRLESDVIFCTLCKLSESGFIP